MEKAVYDGLESMNLTGNDGIYFWLGLYQDENDPEYAEPGNASQNWGGWKWVNGTKLKDGYINFYVDMAANDTMRFYLGAASLHAAEYSHFGGMLVG